MTRRLFYEDAYIDAFDAVVTGCEMVVDAWSVTLDQTAFYPEGGGQPGDTGALGGVRVCDTQDGPDGEIRHITDGPLAVGTAVHGQIDWPVRFSTGEREAAEMNGSDFYRNAQQRKQEKKIMKEVESIGDTNTGPAQRSAPAPGAEQQPAEK